IFVVVVDPLEGGENVGFVGGKGHGGGRVHVGSIIGGEGTIGGIAAGGRPGGESALGNSAQEGVEADALVIRAGGERGGGERVNEGAVDKEIKVRGGVKVMEGWGESEDCATAEFGGGTGGEGDEEAKRMDGELSCGLAESPLNGASLIAFGDGQRISLQDGDDGGKRVGSLGGVAPDEADGEGTAGEKRDDALCGGAGLGDEGVSAGGAIGAGEEIERLWLR